MLHLFTIEFVDESTSYEWTDDAETAQAMWLEFNRNREVGSAVWEVHSGGTREVRDQMDIRK